MQDSPMTRTQQELFLPEKLNEDFLEYIIDRLPRTNLLDVADVATAFDVSNGLIYAWIDEGHLRTFNEGSKNRRRLRIWRPSVLEFADKRMGGM